MIDLKREKGRLLSGIFTIALLAVFLLYYMFCYYLKAEDIVYFSPVSVVLFVHYIGIFWLEMSIIIMVSMILIVIAILLYGYIKREKIKPLYIFTGIYFLDFLISILFQDYWSIGFHVIVIIYLCLAIFSYHRIIKELERSDTK